MRACGYRGRSTLAFAMKFQDRRAKNGPGLYVILNEQTYTELHGSTKPGTRIRCRQNQNRKETSMSAGGFLIVLLIVILGGAYAWYAILIRRRNTALEALSGIDVQLKKRTDLIPNILTIAQKFMDHEKSLLQEITELRTKATASYNPNAPEDVKEHLKAAEQLSDRVGQLMIAVEAYPDLKSNETMVQAQRTYNEVELQLSASRRFYNSAVNSLNTAIQIFPGNVIAGVAGVGIMPSFEASEADRRPVSASEYLR
jgi:LemA protein